MANDAGTVATAGLLLEGVTTTPLVPRGYWLSNRFLDFGIDVTVCLRLWRGARRVLVLSSVQASSRSYVNNGALTSSRPLRRKSSSGIWVKAAVVMLLFFVAGLATLAKNGQYFSKSSPARHVSISTKMDVGHAPAVLPGEVLQPVARFFPPQPPIRASRVVDLPTVPIRQIDIALSMQHRAPPISLP
jgi:hypothetical protein